MRQNHQKIYVLSGLGVDHRVFSSIDFGPFEVVHLPWLKPAHKETITAYAVRLSALITGRAPVLIGLSFGGIMAQEIAKIIPCAKLILLASAKTKMELPALYRIIGRTGLHKLVPGFLFTYSGRFTEWLFGVRTEEQKKLLALILKETDPEFRNWAVNALLTWPQDQAPANTVSIHGSKDRLIPARNVTVDFTLPEAGHFLTVTHAKEVSDLLQAILKQ